jgi:hypothetical protein
MELTADAEAVVALLWDRGSGSSRRSSQDLMRDIGYRRIFIYAKTLSTAEQISIKMSMANP